jgi:MinD superfamily P-loop ATPase
VTDEDSGLRYVSTGIPKIAKDLAVRYARVPGVHIIVRQERCVACGACVKKGFCRFGAIAMVGRFAAINERRCRGCARCTHLCPRDALTIEIRPHPIVRSALMRIDQRMDKLLK